MYLKTIFYASLIASSLISFVSATEVNIAKDLPYVDVKINDKSVKIQRINDTKHKLKNSYIKTSRPTPPFYLQPFTPIEGIKTVTELDVIDFIKNRLSKNKGVLVDARMPKWYQNGTIPAAVNIPFSILMSGFKSQYVRQVLTVLGAREKDKWDFSDAMELLIFDNGPWCQQGVAAMKELVKLGYPKKKILYYRGGMQYWQILGLTTIKPQM